MTYQRLNALSRIEKFGKTPATVFKVIYNIYFTIVDAITMRCLETNYSFLIE